MSVQHLLIIVGFVFALLLGSVAGYLSIEPPAPVATASQAAQLAAPVKPAEPVVDQGDYGPDWPVCRDMGNDPRLRLKACTRLIDRNELTILHQSWAYNNRGTAYRGLGRRDLAMKEFQIALRLAPDNHAPYVNLASIAHNLGREEEALALIDKAIARKPSDTMSYCIRAQALRELNRVDEGLAALDKAEQIAPLSDCALLTRADLLEQEGDKEGALATLAEVRRDKTMVSLAMCRRGSVVWSEGDYQGAFKAYSDAMQLDPTNSCAAVQASFTALYAMEAKDALLFVEATIKARPDLPQLHCYRGRALNLMEKRTEALAAYEQVIADVPGEICGYEYRAVLLEESGDLELARADRETVVRLAPDEASTWRRHGDVLGKLGRWDDAMASYSHAIELEPTDADAILARGDIAFTLKSYADASRDFAKVLELRPGWTHQRYRLALAQLAAGKPQEAISACGQLPAEDDDEAACHIVAARAFLLTQQTSAALHELAIIAPDSRQRGSADLFVMAIDLLSGDVAAAEKGAAAYRAAHPEEPYGALWQALLARAANKALPEDVLALSRKNDIWPAPVLRWLAGSGDAAMVMAAAETPDLRLTQQRRSEAAFYLGVAAFLDGEAASAGKHFQAVRDGGYVETDLKQFPALYQHSNARELTLAGFALADGD